MRRTYTLLTAAAMLTVGVMLSVAGCSGKTGDSTDPDGKTKTSATTGGGPEAKLLAQPLEGEPEVVVLDWTGAQELIGKQSGKVVVVHVWATWNESEDKGLGDIVRLAKLHRDQDVAVFSLVTDFTGFDEPPEAAQEAVDELVKRHGANFKHVISSTPDEKLQDQLKFLGTPAVLVFGKDGQLRERFYHDLDGGRFDYAENVIPKVKELLAEKHTPAAKSPTPAKTANGGSATDVELIVADWEGTQKLVESHKGKVVVLDLWSTSCEPCLKEFPGLVKLHNEHKADVACLSLNLDFIGLDSVEELKPAVLAQLKKFGATFQNVMSNVEDEKLTAQIKLSAIPAVYVYDREGNLKKRFDNESGKEFTYESDIAPLVRELIESSPDKPAPADAEKPSEKN